MKFKAGDRVAIIRNNIHGGAHHPDPYFSVGQVGYVLHQAWTTSRSYIVKLDTSTHRHQPDRNQWTVHEDELELHDTLFS